MKPHVPVHASLLIGVVSLAVTAVGCGGSSVTVTPNFSRPELHQPALHRDGICIVGIEDRRPKPTSQIGTAHVGMFNKRVPYLLTGNLGDNAKTMLDTLIGTSCARDRYLPVTVSVDSFEVGEHTGPFSEEGYFACKLRFMYPVTPDSVGYFSISNTQTTSGLDVTDGLEPLIYKGVAECARLFVEGALDKSPGLVVGADSVAIIAVRSKASSPLASRAEPVAQDISGSSPRTTWNELGFHYSSGGNVTSGARGTYGILSEAEGSDLRWGAGIMLTYYDVRNTEASLAGSFFNFGSRVMAKYFFGKRTSLYVGGGLGFSGGTEKIDYGTSQEDSFFFGPNVEEVVGIALNRKLFLEVGSFQLAYFGSKLLPSDVGIIAGLSLGL